MDLKCNDRYPYKTIHQHFQRKGDSVDMEAETGAMQLPATEQQGWLGTSKRKEGEKAIPSLAPLKIASLSSWISCF